MASVMVLNPSYALSTKAARLNTNETLNVCVEDKKPTQKIIEEDYIVEDTVKTKEKQKIQQEAKHQQQREIENKIRKDNIDRTLEDKIYDDLFLMAGKEYNVDPELIKAVSYHESGYKKDIVSNKGASGLMQLMPDTAKGLGVEDVFSPKQNIHGGTKYLSQLLSKYKNIEIALAAYNAGPGNVDKYNGVPPFEETKKYINNITSSYQLLKEKKVFK